MATPDWETYKLIISGDHDAANARIAANHVDRLPGVVMAAAIDARAVHSGTSSTSVTVETGSKQWTLDNARRWRAGVSIKATPDPSVGDPVATAMFGTLSTNEDDAGLLTVEIDRVKGAGTYTLWNLTITEAQTEVVTPPLGIDLGGTGASDAAGARSNLEVGRFFRILGILSAPPGSPSTGDAYLVGDAPSGGWTENRIATWTGSAWLEVTPAKGDIAYNESGTVPGLYLYEDALQPLVGPWVNSQWRDLLRARPPKKYAYAADVTLTEEHHGAMIALGATLNSLTATLPNPGSVDAGYSATLYRADLNVGNTVTINAAGGGTIAGSASRALAGQYNTLSVLGDGATTYLIQSAS